MALLRLNVSTQKPASSKTRSWPSRFKMEGRTGLRDLMSRVWRRSSRGGKEQGPYPLQARPLTPSQITFIQIIGSRGEVSPPRESLETVVSRVYKPSDMAKELPAFLQKVLDKFSNSRDFTISVALHAILIGLFGGTVLYRAVQEPPDFEGETGGFVQPNETAASPPAQQAPPQETTFNVATVAPQPVRPSSIRSRLPRRILSTSP